MLEKLLCRMVQIDSESGEEEKFIDFVKELFERELGAVGERDSFGNLICRIPGKNSFAEPLLLGAHADTVKPGKGIQPVVEGGIIRSGGETILGADDKAGIAEILEAVRIAAKHPPLEIVISRYEEDGLRGAKNLDFSRLSAKRGVLVDCDLVDVIVIGGPSYFFIDVELTGKAAHAGREPETGISAIRTAALAIAEIPQGRLDQQTTANVGVITGGEFRSSVPAKAWVKAECRSLDHENALLLGRSIKTSFEEVATKYGAQADVMLELVGKSYHISETCPTVELAKRAIASVGLQPKTKVITGVCEAAVYNAHGIETLLLGAGFENEHTIEERINVRTMELATYILTHILCEAA